MKLKMKLKMNVVFEIDKEAQNNDTQAYNTLYKIQNLT